MILPNVVSVGANEKRIFDGTAKTLFTNEHDTSTDWTGENWGVKSEIFE